MKLVELAIHDFDNFAASHPLRNYCQNSAYAKFMGEQGYQYDYIGYQDEITNEIVAASLILYKRIGSFAKYAYAPKGFLIDYYNTSLMNEFIEAMIQRYISRGIVFLKINPEIIIGELNAEKNFAGEYNQNVKIIDDLKSLKFKRRREIIPFEFLAPRISPYINLKKFNPEDLEEDFKNTLELSKKKGLKIENATAKEVGIYYNFIKDYTTQPINYYRNLLNIFAPIDKADLVLVKIDHKDFLLNVRENYDIESERNNEFNRLIQEDASEENLNLKMESDKLLLQLKNDIVEATEGLKHEEDEYVAGAIIIKHLNRISILLSGFNKKFATTYPLHYLYGELIERYKNDYDYIDLNGITSDFSTTSPHYDMNIFKLGFKPDIYEFIGEFDIILNETNFKKLQTKHAVAREMSTLRII